MSGLRCHKPSPASPSCTSPATASIWPGRGPGLVSPVSRAAAIAQVRTAEDAAQNWVTGSVEPPGSTKLGRAMPRAAKIAATAIPTPFTASNAGFASERIVAGPGAGMKCVRIRLSVPVRTDDQHERDKVAHVRRSNDDRDALESRNLTRVSRALCETNGIRVVRLHDLHHTCVSLLLAQGVHPRVVMEIVGHSAIEMVMNVYGHVNLDTQRQALDDLDSGLSNDADS